MAIHLWCQSSAIVVSNDSALTAVSHMRAKNVLVSSMQVETSLIHWTHCWFDISCRVLQTICHVIHSTPCSRIFYKILQKLQWSGWLSGFRTTVVCCQGLGNIRTGAAPRNQFTTEPTSDLWGTGKRVNLLAPRTEVTWLSIWGLPGYEWRRRYSVCRAYCISWPWLNTTRASVAALIEGMCSHWSSPSSFVYWLSRNMEARWKLPWRCRTSCSSCQFPTWH
jgi:hypothetical protein